MITLTKNGNAIVFTFEDNAHYLFDGTIEVPVNSLTLITDNSQMATFKKSASNDVFISARYDELGMSKAELESWFKENACGSTGGGGVTSGEVETMIDQAISGKQDTLIAGSGITISGNVISSEGGNKVVELTQAQYDALVDKDPDTFYIITDASAIDINNYYNKTEVDTALAAKANTATTYTKTEVDTALANKADTSAVTEAISSAVSGKVNTSAFNTYSAATDSRIAEDEEVTAAALNDLQENKADTSAVTAVANDVSTLSGAVEDAGAYYISFATIATTGIRDEDWDGIVAAIDGHRPIYAGYPRQDGGIIYYGVECMNKNVSNTEIVMTASDNESHYFYTFTKNGSNDYSYTVSTKPYVPDITTSITSGSTDSEIPTAKAVYDAVGQGGVTVDSAFSRTSENPVQNKVISDNVTNGKCSVSNSGGKYKLEFYSVGGIGTNKGFYLDTINGEPVVKQYNVTRNLNLVETSAITSAITSASTNAEVAGAKAVYDAIQAGGGSITVDSALDATSENPVQNKVIYAAIGDIESLLSNI